MGFCKVKNMETCYTCLTDLAKVLKFLLLSTCKSESRRLTLFHLFHWFITLHDWFYTSTIPPLDESTTTRIRWSAACTCRDELWTFAVYKHDSCWALVSSCGWNAGHFWLLAVNVLKHGNQCFWIDKVCGWVLWTLKHICLWKLLVMLDGPLHFRHCITF